jgi:ribosomal-protein-alanine N-acetyltransferase
MLSSVERDRSMPRTHPPRVELRPPTLDDRDEFIAAMRASRALHRPWLSPPTTPAAFDAFLRRVDDEFSEPMILVRVDDRALLGYFVLSWIIRGPLQSAFLGYGAVAAHAGHGYMTEGMQRVLRRAFTELRLHRVEANIQPGNKASIALARRCGFEREGYSPRYLKIGGRWRDHERWAITIEQWRRHSKPSGGPIVAASGPKLST